MHGGEAFPETGGEVEPVAHVEEGAQAGEEDAMLRGAGGAGDAVFAVAIRLRVADDFLEVAGESAAPSCAAKSTAVGCSSGVTASGGGVVGAAVELGLGLRLERRRRRLWEGPREEASLEEGWEAEGAGGRAAVAQAQVEPTTHAIEMEPAAAAAASIQNEGTYSPTALSRRRAVTMFVLSLLFVWLAAMTLRHSITGGKEEDHPASAAVVWSLSPLVCGYLFYLTVALQGVKGAGSMCFRVTYLLLLTGAGARLVNPIAGAAAMFMTTVHSAVKLGGALAVHRQQMGTEVAAATAAMSASPYRSSAEVRQVQSNRTVVSVSVAFLVQGEVGLFLLMIFVGPLLLVTRQLTLLGNPLQVEACTFVVSLVVGIFVWIVAMVVACVVGGGNALGIVVCAAALAMAGFFGCGRGVEAQYEELDASGLLVGRDEEDACPAHIDAQQPPCRPPAHGAETEEGLPVAVLATTSLRRAGPQAEFQRFTFCLQARRRSTPSFPFAYHEVPRAFWNEVPGTRDYGSSHAFRVTTTICTRLIVSNRIEAMESDKPPQEFVPKYEVQENATTMVFLLHLAVRGHRRRANGALHSRFNMVFHLPATFDPDGTRARFDDGVLTITVPKKDVDDSDPEVDTIEARPEPRRGQGKPQEEDEAKTKPQAPEHMEAAETAAWKSKDNATPKEEDATSSKKPPAAEQPVDVRVQEELQGLAGSDWVEGLMEAVMKNKKVIAAAFSASRSASSPTHLGLRAPEVGALARPPVPAT
nr:unnamed protein product [Digitaria exilis]